MEKSMEKQMEKPISNANKAPQFLAAIIGVYNMIIAAEPHC
jgi:hypothetical protein